MSLPRKKRDETSATITQTLGLILACSAIFALTAFGAPPSWWSSRGAIHAPVVVTNDGVVSTNYITNDYAAVTQGQLKQFTARAVDELNVDLTNYGGAGSDLTNLVYGWQQDYTTNGYNATNIKPSDYTAMNVGQLKSIGGLVYGRLSAAGYTELTPSWLHQNTNSDNVVANIGQLKQLFYFDLSLPGASGLTATAGSSGTINLSWTLPSTNNVTSWLIEQQGTDGAWNVLTNLPDSTATSYSVTGLTNGDSYNFQVIGTGGSNSVAVPSRASGTPVGVPTSGLTLWLKADDATNVTRDGSGNVSSWADETGNYTVSQSGSTRPTYVASDVNGKPALRFNGSQWLYSSSSVTGVSAGMTMITVGMSTTPSNEQYSVCLGSNSSGTSRIMGYYANDQIFHFDTPYYTGSTAPFPNTFVEEIGSINSALNSLTFYRNGVQTATVGIGGIGAVSSGLTVGSALNGLSHPWQGDIAEVLIYDHQLDSTELTQVDGYLADKYGYYSPNATWPSTYSSAVQAEITRNQWTKAQADAYVTFLATSPAVPPTGLNLWLKADAGVVADGSSNVSQWVDQGPASHVAVQDTAGNKPVAVTDGETGQAALSFNGSQWIAGSDYIPANQDVTIISVAKATDSTAWGNIAAVGTNVTSEGTMRGLAFNSSRFLFDIYLNSTGAGVVPSSGHSAIEDVTYQRSSGDVSFYLDGIANGTSSISVSDLNPGFIVGAGGWFGTGWAGNISEVLVYNRILTSTERQQAEIYLANKYGLYYDTAPTIAPAAGSYTSSQTVTISSPVTSGVIHYTLDGSVPTVESPVYTSPLMLSASALVQAALYFEGNVSGPIAGAQFYINDPTHTGFPVAPTGLTATSISSSETDLSWTLGGEVNYSAINVYRSTNGGDYVLVAVLDPSATSYADQNVVAGDSYTYEVGTVNSSGISDTSASSSVTPPADSTLTIIVTTPSGAVALP